MFTVDEIIDNIIILERRDNKEMILVDKSLLSGDFKEGSIVDLVDGKYIVNDTMTNQVSNNIRERFNRLKE